MGPLFVGLLVGGLPLLFGAGVHLAIHVSERELRQLDRDNPLGARFLEGCKCARCSYRSERSYAFKRVAKPPQHQPD